jgi:hypothetical protein
LEIFDVALASLLPTVRAHLGRCGAVRQDETLSAINHPLYAPGGTTSVLALAVARRQREIIGNSLYTSARYATRWWRFTGRTRYAS